MKREDIRQQVTDKIVSALEKGGLKAWRRPWRLVQGENGLPFNLLTSQQYRGINTMMLLVEQLEKGYSTNAWLTFKQASDMGGCIRKGERSTLIVRYIASEESESEDEAEGRDNCQTTRRRGGLRGYNVFNLDQIEGIERADNGAEEKPVAEKIRAVERMLLGLQRNTGLVYYRTGNSACYSPCIDRLKMPSGEFDSQEDYAATLGHELVHCTGHKSRLDRLAKVASWYPDTEEAYAFEELVAELGAAMLCAEHGIVGELQHESYIDSWLRALKSDKTLIFKAAKLASEAHVYLADHTIKPVALPAAA